MSAAGGPAGPAVRADEEPDRPHLQAIREAATRPVFASVRRIVGAWPSPFALGVAEREQAAHPDSLRSGAATILVAALGGVPVGFCAYTVNGATAVGEVGRTALHTATTPAGASARGSWRRLWRA